MNEATRRLTNEGPDLGDLLKQLEPEMAVSRRKDVRTAVWALAEALGFSDPRYCSPEVYSMPLSRMRRLMESQLSGKGPHTLRNVKNNLSFLFRLAIEKGLIRSLSELPERRFEFAHRPARRGSECSRNTGYYLRFKDWPETLRIEFERFYRWATDPVMDGRSAQWRKRAITLEGYRQSMETYFGYLFKVRGVASIRFDQLYDFELLQNFVTWHVNERHNRVTASIGRFLSFTISISFQYAKLPHLSERLKALRDSLGKPPPFYDKTEAWVPLRDLDLIGKALWPQKGPEHVVKTGTNFAVHAGASLMLRLWCRRPYRQRNIREMLLGENLRRVSDGSWEIEFAGEQLKVEERRGQRNTFLLPFPKDLVSILEEYLRIWRPFLVKRTKHDFPHVFLNRLGKPYSMPTLTIAVKRYVYDRSGIATHPHLFRSVWTTEYIRKTGDFYGAAIMLNDSLMTVIKNYAHLMDRGVAERADQWLKSQLGGEQEAKEAVTAPVSFSRGPVWPYRNTVVAQE